MISRDDPQFLWVSPEVAGGNGTYDNPFCCIENALEKAEPGNTIVLMSGSYDGDVTIQTSGSIDKPIKIISDENVSVEITKGCWFFYDTSDLIVSGLTFRDSPHGAISVIGACQRNRFENLTFLNCGISQKESCTMYFGGSGAECNIVDKCHFTRPLSEAKESGVSIALMVSDGDKGANAPSIKHHLFRRNTFCGYSHAMIIGSESTDTVLYGHIVEYNTIDNCSSDGILVKCNDTTVHCNLIRKCNGSGIKIASGTQSSIEDNRIEDCLSGISVNGSGHAIVNNCIVNPVKSAVVARSASSETCGAATNLFIEKNLIVNTNPANSSEVCLKLEKDSTTFINCNLIHGFATPYEIASVNGKADTQHCINDNAGSGIKGSFSGISGINAEFDSETNGNFENSTIYGAHGWVLKPEGFNPSIDDLDSNDNYLDVYSLDNEDDGEEQNRITPEQRELFHSMFGDQFDDEDIAYEDHGISFNERDDV